MTNSQKLALRLSELRQKLNALSAKDELTEAEQDEMRSLSGAYPQIEERWRAAQIAEGAEEDAARGEDPDQGDGEAAEVRRLRETVRLSDYLSPAAAGIGLSGGAAEFNAALSLPTVGASGGIAVPWDALLTPELSETRQDPDPERRAFTTTTQYAGGVGQRPILQRLFGMDILAALGVRLDSVPRGADGVAATDRRRCPGAKGRGDRGGRRGSGDVLNRGSEAEAPNGRLRIHPRTGGAGSRAGSRATARPGGRGALEDERPNPQR